jgi:hypothetical protein
MDRFYQTDTSKIFSMTEYEKRKKERMLLKEMNLLCAKRLMKPSLQASRRMNEIFFELYELTGDNKYLL